jgi:hypothetical protein
VRLGSAFVCDVNPVLDAAHRGDGRDDDGERGDRLDGLFEAFRVKCFGLGM